MPNREQIKAAAAKTWAFVFAHKVAANVIEATIVFVVGYLLGRFFY